MLRRLFAILLAMVVVILIVGFMLPATVTVERDRPVEAEAPVLFEVLSDLRHFTRWSPWLDADDPDGFRLEGTPSGVGATLVWREGSDAGASRLWITAVERPHRVDFDLEFGDNPARGWFRIEPEGLGQRVYWGMTMEFGMLDLVGRYVGLIMPGLIGAEYESGLEALADYLAQAPPGQVPALPDDLPADFRTEPGSPR